MIKTIFVFLFLLTIDVTNIKLGNYENKPPFIVKIKAFNGRIHFSFFFQVRINKRILGVFLSLVKMLQLLQNAYKNEVFT